MGLFHAGCSTNQAILGWAFDEYGYFTLGIQRIGYFFNITLSVNHKVFDVVSTNQGFSLSISVYRSIWYFFFALSTEQDSGL